MDEKTLNLLYECREILKQDDHLSPFDTEKAHKLVSEITDVIDLYVYTPTHTRDDRIEWRDNIEEWE